MKIRVEVQMLAMVVALYLALGMSDGLVIDKCELGDELNSTLPAKLLDRITNLVAKIVCHVELSSHFNTSTIKHVTGPNIHSFIRGGHGGRKGRSAESSSEESSEENIQVPKHGFNSSVVNPVTHLHGNKSSSGEGHRGRKGRSAESSSEESSEEDTGIPQHNPVAHSQVVNPVTHLHGNKSSSGEGHRGRKGRSAESSSKESEEGNTWTLYGLFQLPDRIACTSGLEPSLNICNMACDRLIDDNIRDDITCVETIINKM
ncbi:hypothetical protein PDJAM_G00161510 [Pangasius djambal]|uniref:Uncharacterized protein n=1 Tax=Pangasius djambal TaxID=1691987 RepID=A0ACC5ZJT8_9TELE|nr:hypothetical protein [Pangasius djambal]